MGLMKARALSICRSYSAVPLLLLILCFSISTKGEEIGGKNGHDEELGQQNGRPSWVKSVSALADTAFPYTAMYLEKARWVVEKANGYLFRPRRPDIDFRETVEDEEGEKEAIPGDDDEIGASKLERVREAASMSLEKSKSTLEDSAKLAGDTLHQVTDKIKNKLTNHPQGHRPAEL